MSRLSGPSSGPTLRRLTTPRAAALAGVVFAVLFGTMVFLIRTNMPEGVQDSTRWLNTQHSGIATATALMPFAGISFLWFIGVVRDGFGRFEDRFFASVFLGSGLLFAAMSFVGAAVTGGLIATAAARSAVPGPDPRALSRQVTRLALHVYALRMAAVFTFARRPSRSGRRSFRDGSGCSPSPSVSSCWSAWA